MKFPLTTLKFKSKLKSKLKKKREAKPDKSAQSDSVEKSEVDDQEKQEQEKTAVGEDYKAGSRKSKMKVPASLRGMTRVSSKDFTSPLGVIDEEITPPTRKSTILASVSVQDPTSDELEVIIGDKDAIKRQLFDAEDEHIKEDTPLFLDYEEEEEEEPFDAPTEDPTITEILKTQSQEEEENRGLGTTVVETPTVVITEEKKEIAPRAADSGVARKLIDAFNCGPIFYDDLCTAMPPEKKQKRPYYNKEFTLEFIEQAATRGVPLLYHQPPEEENDDWTGRSVTMFLRLGDCYSSEFTPPQLEWITMDGSRFGDIGQNAVSLLGIHSILDSADDDPELSLEESHEEEEEGMHFFSITTKEGAVYLFEATSEEERDYMVNGIKNVVARLSFHLVLGDEAVTSELFSPDYGQESGELPALKSSIHAMKIVTHEFLDS